MATLRLVEAGSVKSQSLSPIDDTTRGQAAAIIAEVREGGEAGLLRLATKFGDIAEGASHPHGPRLS